MVSKGDIPLILEYAVLAALVIGSIYLAYGAHAQSLEEAQQLIAFDPRATVEDQSFLLATHGYNVPQVGLLIYGNETYQFENGTLEGIRNGPSKI